MLNGAYSKLDGGLQKKVFPCRNPCELTLFMKRVFAYIIKDLETRSPWIIRMDPKANDKCPYKEMHR